ncbi:hypothetical protein [Mycobacteroides abscessus]|uniref:hypothetical protein n=1 Tax=Mycobacteroides abscessus TaxID=36809 RepID=UPI001F256532|nr:hypothetical protein [Mycobacteroides abscessus]
MVGHLLGWGLITPPTMSQEIAVYQRIYREVRMQSEGRDAECVQRESIDEASDTDEEIAALIAELTSLRTSEGLSTRGLADTPALRAILAASGGHSADNLAAGKAYLEALLMRDDEIDTVVAYRNALRLGPVTEHGVDNRRRIFGELRGVSPDTVKRREKDGINELVARLRDLAAHAGHDRMQPVPAAPDGASTAKSTVLFVDRLSRYEGTVLKEVTSSKTIQAEATNRQIRTVKFRLRTDPERVRIEALDGCTIESSEPHPSGFLISKIRLSRILQPGDEPLTYTTRYVIDSTEPCDPFIIYSTPPKARIEKARLRVKFSTPPRPTIAWWRENRTAMQASSDLTGEPLIIDGEGSMQHTFTNLVPGLCQLIAWKWPDE